jgi:nicotinamide riboside kinase
MKVINLFGGPGTGKSTTAAGLFYLLKINSHESELALEYAKYLVWSKRINMLEDQNYVFAKQTHRLAILKDQVEYAVTDCPLLLASIYGSHLSPAFQSYVLETFETYDNINIYMNRVKEFKPNGRTQNTAEEADEISVQVKELLQDLEIPFVEIDANHNAPWKIYEAVIGKEARIGYNG